MAENKYGIIVGYDGSECGDRALDWALEEAELRGTALTIFHSWHYPYTGMMGPVISEIENAGKQTLMTAVQRAKAQAPDVTVKPLLAYGSPGLTLVERSKEADLVIVGSHGHGGFQELMLGSVSNQVSLYATSPVIVVRGPADPAADNDPGQIVVGADGSPAADLAVGVAFEQAQLRGLPLTAVCAWHLPEHAIPKMPYVNADGLWKLAEERFQDTLTRWHSKYPEVKVLAEFTDAPAVEALTSAATDARLVVVGSRGLGSIRRRLLGSVSQDLLHSAPCPVEIVHARHDKDR